MLIFICGRELCRCRWWASERRDVIQYSQQTNCCVHEDIKCRRLADVSTPRCAQGQRTPAATTAAALSLLCLHLPPQQQAISSPHITPPHKLSSLLLLSLYPYYCSEPLGDTSMLTSGGRKTTRRCVVCSWLDATPTISLAHHLLVGHDTAPQYSLTFALQQGQGCGSLRKKHLPWQREHVVPPKPRVVPVLPVPSQTGHLVIGDGDSMLLGDSYRLPTVPDP